ncbi:MAG: ATP-binding cassette domain-containing protein, partial [Planctomycetota bacterium]
MIAVRNLQFRYGQSRFGLSLDALDVPTGARVCWVGPSGTGKTTLLHLAAGILVPAAGTVTTCGVKLSELAEPARRDFRIAQVGLVFQDFALLDYLHVLDNILLPYRINQSLQLDADVRARAERLAADVGLADMLFRRPHQLSQGERQRVAACRAVVTQPAIVLADEPTANLDQENAARVINVLEHHAEEQQATLVVVSHDPYVK